MLAKRLMAGSVAGSSGSSGVTLSNQNVMAMGSGTQTATYKLTNTGVAEDWSSGFPVTLETWLLSGTANQYEARVTETAGTLDGGAGVGSWLSLGTTREWYIQENTSEWSKSCAVFVEIRLIAGPSPVLASANIELNASVF